MNWFWLRSRRYRRVTSAGGLAYDSAGRPAWGEGGPADRVRLARRGARGGSGRVHWFAGQHRAGPGRHGGLRIAVHLRAVPDAPVGRQLTWFLRALADLPLSQQVIRAHFDSGVLAHISAEQLNSALAQPSAPGGASLLGLLWEDPARDPVSLLAMAAFGSVTLTVDVRSTAPG